jgi:hypothetical protein
MKYYLPVLLAFLFSCSQKPSEDQQTTPEMEINEKDFTAEPAPEWTNLFLRKSGWFGGDGIFAIPYSGKDSEKGDSLLFLFSDTMIGEIDGEKLKPGSVMVNNSVAILKDKTPDSAHIAFKMAKDNDVYKAIFAPQSDKPDKDTYFWLGDGFVNPDANKDLFLFAYKITNTKDKSAFPFKEIGNSLIRIPANSPFPYADQKHIDLPFNNYGSGEETISFGAGVYNNAESAGEVEPDGFLYIYGTKGVNKKLVAARVKPELIESFDNWEFWNGTTWSKDAKAHPTLSANGELLISYNVNSFKFSDVIKKKPNLYRPRFIRVKFKTQPTPTTH